MYNNVKMQTKQLYYEDQYKKQAKAKIISIEKNVSLANVILDQTIFYPEGGGQPSDQGTIKGKEGTLQVQQVLIKDGEIVHIGKLTGTISTNDVVDCSIDWNRRYKNMRVHTAGHIINDATMSLFPDLVPVDGEHGGKSYIKYEGTINQISTQLIKEKANEIVSQNLPIKTEFVTLEELRKRATWVPPHLPKNKPLRIMQIGMYSVIPDGGTQLKKTGEVLGISEINLTTEANFVFVNYKIITAPETANAKDLTSQPVSGMSGFDANEVINIKNQSLAQITSAADNEELEEIRIELLGRNGKITNLIKRIKEVPVGERQQTGILINETKVTIENLLADQKNSFKETARQWFDPTVPAKDIRLGKTHFVSRAIEEISATFEKIGFTRSRYPEVEWDYYAFGALNFPENHPARDDWETFFVDTDPSAKYGPMLLTPHTSSGQIREMENNKPPIRMINIAKCYRRQIDVSHYPMFHQFEGLVVDKGIAITHLRGTIDYFAKSFFGPTRVTRLRPYHFQFTEPSFEVDISCNICGGSGRVSSGAACKLCKEGWLEIGGAGMVHPNVLKNCGIDFTVYSGFAFGWGVERTYMMKSGLSIPDVRLLYSSDLRVLSQI
jgi:phenylalanyl-tRNA synthetase alpha chain